MMKKILVLILCVLVYSALFAQSNEDKKTVFQLSFVAPEYQWSLFASVYEYCFTQLTCRHFQKRRGIHLGRYFKHYSE